MLLSLMMSKRIKKINHFIDHPIKAQQDVFEFLIKLAAFKNQQET